MDFLFFRKLYSWTICFEKYCNKLMSLNLKNKK
nr:MAG TPA_asm: hypothetical protein [Caudoviricetes sp.]